MVTIHLIDSKGWELPDHYNCGPPVFTDEGDALEIVIDALSHTINMPKLKDVNVLRVMGSDGRSVDFPKERWCYWD